MTRASPAFRAVVVLLVTAVLLALTGLRIAHDPERLLRWGIGFWAIVIVVWVLAWQCNVMLAKLPVRSLAEARFRDLAIPLVFGLTLLFLWECVCLGASVPFVLMPPPSAIGSKIAASLPILYVDFMQTFVRSVLPGWFIGTLAGFVTAVVCDRVPFLRRGLLPVGSFVSALPIIGIAPIMVMWFGFDWHSKAAVVVVMTFFPMLVNTVAGLAAAGALKKDLMRSYGANYGSTLVKLRLPAALPFIFNALKITSTLALVGAIVAEFFGTPTVGMGFRISTEVGRMGLDMVWAEVAVAALTGSAFYGLLAAMERGLTFWHPSFRA